jgi:GT2 family glycosyltransferase
MPTFQDELYCQYVYEMTGSPDEKDIIVVVHDQLDFIEKCVESLYKNTKNFKLYLWDNNSMAPTREYLQEVARTHDNVVLVRHSENIGFIEPNNELVRLGKSPYIVLLNSDTEVSKGWDTALIGWLKSNPNCTIVGYHGGTLDADGRGWGGRIDDKIDYVSGWCLCISRQTYDSYGLFDGKNLSFAYGEDSDFSLRMREAGFDVHALHMNLVLHYGNVTALEVNKVMDTTPTFNKNHEYIRQRWANYLANDRVRAKSA